MKIFINVLSLVTYLQNQSIRIQRIYLQQTFLFSYKTNSRAPFLKLPETLLVDLKENN